MGQADTRPEVGAPVTLRLRKWDGSPHRQASLAYVGADEFGRWFAIPTGVEVPDPTASSTTRAPHVMLLPHDGRFLAHFNAPPARNTVYADLTTTPEFGRDGDDWVITATDLDLDVVRRATGRCWIDDEDEFADHTFRYGYPAEVVATTRATATALLDAVRNGTEPFGTTWQRWIRRLREVLPDEDRPRGILLAGDRLDLEPLRVDHAEEMAPVLDDPALHTFTGGEPATITELRQRYARQVVGHSPDRTERWLNWIVRRREDGQVIGFVQATVADHDQQSRAEVAWVIGSAFQGHGYAREAAGLMINWLRQQPVVLIMAHIHPDHGASAAVARGLGLAPTGEVVDGELRWVG